MDKAQNVKEKGGSCEKRVKECRLSPRSRGMSMLYATPGRAYSPPPHASRSYLSESWVPAKTCRGHVGFGVNVVPYDGTSSRWTPHVAKTSAGAGLIHHEQKGLGVLPPEALFLPRPWPRKSLRTTRAHRLCHPKSLACRPNLRLTKLPKTGQTAMTKSGVMMRARTRAQRGKDRVH